MEKQKLYSKLRQAIDAYHMIEEGDKIAVGLSGGKDSLGLILGLAGLQKFYPKAFTMVAITVDLGYGQDFSALEQFCQSLGVEFVLVQTSIGEMAAKEGCSLCARLRKGALHDKAKELGANKIAYAHNRDDVVETMLLSLLYEGRFSTFWPVTKLERTGLVLIRPFVFVTQAEAAGVKNKYHLPVLESACPFDKTSERSYVRELMKSIEKHAPGIRQRLMSAICDGTISEWKK